MTARCLSCLNGIGRDHPSSFSVIQKAVSATAYCRLPCVSHFFFFTKSAYQRTLYWMVHCLCFAVFAVGVFFFFSKMFQFLSVVLHRLTPVLERFNAPSTLPPTIKPPHLQFIPLCNSLFISLVVFRIFSLSVFC